MRLHSLESKRSKLELDAPLNWQPVEFKEWFMVRSHKFKSLHRSTGAQCHRISVFRHRVKFFASRPRPRLLARGWRPRTRHLETGLGCSRDPRPWS